jgi:hypothetical protein
LNGELAVAGGKRVPDCVLLLAASTIGAPLKLTDTDAERFCQDLYAEELADVVADFVKAL